MSQPCVSRKVVERVSTTLRRETVSTEVRHSRISRATLRPGQLSRLDSGFYGVLKVLQVAVFVKFGGLNELVWDF